MDTPGWLYRPDRFIQVHIFMESVGKTALLMSYAVIPIMRHADSFQFEGRWWGGGGLVFYQFYFNKLMWVEKVNHITFLVEPR